MKTVSVQILNNPGLLDEMRIFNNSYRMAFNRYTEGLSEKEVRAYVSQRISHNSWFIQSSIKEAHSLFAVAGKKRVIFGGIHNFKQYMNGLISKELFNYNRMVPVCLHGEMNNYGNRLVKFDLLNSRLIYKPSRNNHKEIQFCPVKKKLAQELAKVQELA